jgi:predicted alpha/beta-hydrolase family hydrolase
MHSTQHLAVSGYHDEPVPHTFLRSDGPTEHLALILPGVAYTCDHPLLYYPSRLLMDRGADVLRVEYSYSERPEFKALPDAEQMRWLLADVTAVVRAGLAQRAYQRATLVGKSMGTLAMGHLLGGDTLPRDTDAVWLTPLLKSDRVRDQIKASGRRSLFVIGTADPYYDAANLAGVQAATGGEAVVVDGADHSMEIAGDVLASLDAIRRIMVALKRFLA